MAVEYPHGRRPPITASILDGGRIVSTLGAPLSFQLGNQPQRLLQENARRAGCWLWGFGQSLPTAGSAAAPAAGALVTPKLALPAGAFDVYVSVVFVGGAPTAATDGSNWQLLLGPLGAAGAGNQVGGGVFQCPIALNQGASRTIRVIVPAPTNLAVAAVGAATAGTTYQAELLATPLDPILVGLDKASLGAGSLDQQRGWAIGGFPFWLPGEQELWAIANSATQPAELRIWEIFKEPRGRMEIDPDGSVPE